MTVPKICREVNAAYLKQWGEPSGSIVFENPAYLPTSKLSVFIWEASDEDDITLAATIGMCCASMADAQHRAELHFAIAGLLTNQEITSVARYLANLTAYPFDNHTHLDWWHKLSDTGSIPRFTGFKSALLHPKFAESGLDTIGTSEGLVKILNIVPLLPEEAAIASVSALVQYFQENNIDLFSPRKNEIRT